MNHRRIDQCHSRPSGRGETGHTWEVDYLYSTQEQTALRIPATASQIPGNIPQDLTFRDALRYCIEKSPYRYTPENVSDPRARNMNALHYFLCEELECETDALRVYPGICTSADRRGADFIIIYHDPITDSEIHVTADLTRNNVKVENEDFCADILITPYGCIAHPEYYKKFEKQYADEGGRRFAHYGGQDDNEKDDEVRAEGAAKLIGKIIHEKMRARIHAEPEPNQVHRIDRHTHSLIAHLFGDDAHSPGHAAAVH